MIQAMSVVGVVFVLTVVFADSITNLWAVPFQRREEAGKAPSLSGFLVCKDSSAESRIAG